MPRPQITDENGDGHFGYGELLKPSTVDALITQHNEHAEALDALEAGGGGGGNSGSLLPLQEWEGGATNDDILEVNDWAPDGLQDSTLIVVRGADNEGTRITGIDSTGIIPGDIRYLVNLPYGLEAPLDSGTITFLHEDSRSLAANRIQTPGAVEYTVPMYSVTALIYGGLDADGNNRWRIMSDGGRSSHVMVQRINLYPSCAVGDASTPVTGTVNDWRPTANTPWTPGYLVAGGTTDSYDYTTLRVYTGVAGLTVTGLYTGEGVGTMQALGNLKFIQNVGEGELTLKHNSGSSSVGMRLFLPRSRDLVLGPYEGVWLFSTFHNNIENSVANWYAIGMGNEIFPSITTEGITNLGGALNLSGVVTPSNLAAGNTHDYNPGSRDAIWRIGSHASGSTLTGIIAPALGDYELHFIQNVGSGTLSFTNLDTGSSVGNRFQTPRSLTVTIGAQGGAVVRYDWAQNAWVILATTGNPFNVTFSSAIDNILPVYDGTTGLLGMSAISDDGTDIGIGTSRALVQSNAPITRAIGYIEARSSSGSPGLVVGPTSKQYTWYVNGNDLQLYEYNAAVGGAGNDRARFRSGGGFHPNGATGPFITSGSGTPEGAVTAPVGSLYMRSDGGAGTSLYVKESGTGNTGWVAK